jgi:hypothetical protein
MAGMSTSGPVERIVASIPIALVGITADVNRVRRAGMDLADATVEARRKIEKVGRKRDL